ncbi:MAG: hypothetical protein V1716_01920 [Candidatus Uhrbacteria bacterium]
METLTGPEAVIYWVGMVIAFASVVRLAFCERLPRPFVVGLYLSMFVIGGGCGDCDRVVTSVPAVDVGLTVCWFWFVGWLIFGSVVAYRGQNNCTGVTLGLFFGSIFTAIIGAGALAEIFSRSFF